MVRNIKLYVEGGNTADQKKQMRIAFTQFLRKASGNKRLNVVPSGARSETYKNFCREVTQNDTELVLLLVDSEGPVNGPAWAHLQKQDKWPRPKDVQDAQCHFMVQLMESWFIADVETLASFYGTGFNKNQIPKNNNVEQVPKSEIESSLKAATTKTKKREYHKMKHGPDILRKLDPEKVRRASEHFDQLLQQLQR